MRVVDSILTLDVFLQVQQVLCFVELCCEVLLLLSETINLGLHKLLGICILSLPVLGLLKEGQIGPNGRTSGSRSPHCQISHQVGVLGGIHFHEAVRRLLLRWALFALYALLIVLLDILVAAFYLTSLSSKDLQLRFLFLVLVHHGCLLFFKLTCKAIFLLQTLLQILDPHSDRVTLVPSQEGLSCNIFDGAFNVVSGLDSIFEIALDVAHLLRF